MACEIIKQQIIEGKLNPMIKEHLESCESCQNFYDNHLKIEEELLKTYSGKEDFRSNKDTIMRSLKPKRKLKTLLVAALIITTITITFAEEIPLVGDLLRYFSRDAGAEAAVENDYPIQDLVYEKHGYILYVKDLYFDPYIGQYKIAVEKDGEYLRGFSYSVTQGPWERNWQEGRKGNTPWIELTFVTKDVEDLEMSIGIRIDQEEIIFDPIKISNDTIEKYKTIVVECNQTIETEYGELTIDNIEIYPTAMYLNTSYDFVDSIVNFQLTDLKLIDDLGNEYLEDVIHYQIYPEGKQTFRLLGSSYDKNVKWLKLSLSSITLKSVDEIANSAVAELEGFEFYHSGEVTGNSFTINDVNKNGEDIKFAMDVKYLNQSTYPPLLVIWSEGRWLSLEKLQVIEVPLARNKQQQWLPLFILCEWLDMDIKSIGKDFGAFEIEENTDYDTSNFKYSLQQSNNYTREDLEVLFKKYDVDSTVVDLDYVFKVKAIETQWFNPVDLEIISGVLIDELKMSDEAKIKLIEHMKQYYVYYDLNSVDHFINSVLDYGNVGKGGQIWGELSKILYGGSTKDQIIRIGVRGNIEHLIEESYTFEIK